MPEIVIPYTLNPVQRQIHDLAQRIRFLVVAAHRGAGKSLAAVNEALDAALFTPTEALGRIRGAVPQSDQDDCLGLFEAFVRANSRPGTE
jgi:hypothetical protein